MTHLGLVFIVLWLVYCLRVLWVQLGREAVEWVCLALVLVGVLTYAV